MFTHEEEVTNLLDQPKGTQQFEFLLLIGLSLLLELENIEFRLELGFTDEVRTLDHLLASIWRKLCQNQLLWNIHITLAAELISFKMTSYRHWNFELRVFNTSVFVAGFEIVLFLKPCVVFGKQSAIQVIF